MQRYTIRLIEDGIMLSIQPLNGEKFRRVIFPVCESDRMRHFVVSTGQGKYWYADPCFARLVITDHRLIIAKYGKETLGHGETQTLWYSAEPLQLFEQAAIIHLRHSPQPVVYVSWSIASGCQQKDWKRPSVRLDPFDRLK